MSESNLIAAILTAALNASRQIHPKPGQPGGSEHQLVMKDYKQFLEMVEAQDKAGREPGMAR